MNHIRFPNLIFPSALDRFLLVLRGNEPSIRRNLGDCFFHLGSFDLACDEYLLQHELSKAQQNMVETQRACTNLGNVYLELLDEQDKSMRFVCLK